MNVYARKDAVGVSGCYAIEKFLRTVMDIVVKIQNTVRRRIVIRISVSLGILT